jgi:hypothetical protein
MANMREKKNGDSEEGTQADGSLPDAQTILQQCQ